MKSKILYPLLALVPILLLLFFATPVQAESFQDRYSEELDATDFTPRYEELMDKYDSEEMSFDCGTFDIHCKFYDMTFQIVVSGLNFTLDRMYSTILEPSDITGNDIYNSYQNGISGLSYTLFAIFISFSMAKVVSTRIGDSSDGPIVMNEKILSIISIGIFLGIYAQFMDWVLRVQQYTVQGILNTFDQQNFLDKLVSMFLVSTDFGIMALLLFMVLSVVFTFQLFYRMALVALLYMVGPVAIVTKLNDNYNFFDMWIKQLIIAFLSYILQVLAIVVGLKLLVAGEVGSVSTIFFGIGFFCLAVSIPTILGSFGFSTGSMRQITNVTRTAGTRLAR